MLPAGLLIWFSIPPPQLPEKVTFVSDGLELELYIPQPEKATLLEKVTFLSVGLLLSVLDIPPPLYPPALLPEKVTSVREGLLF